jgi:hypothetical protein
MGLGLRYPVDQAGGQWRKQRDEPQAPPERTLRAPHQLVPAEAAETVEGPGDAAAVPALMQLQPAVRAARLLGMVEDHGRLVASRAEARSNERERRQLHNVTSVPRAAGFTPAATLFLITAKRNLE